MRKRLKHSISGYHMPLFMKEILSENFCDSFLKMSISYDEDIYMFNYETDWYEKIKIEKLDTSSKLVLIESLIMLNSKAESWFIRGENYLLEPELVYSVRNSVYEEDLKILFYPDFKRMAFSKKLILFIDKIKKPNDLRECEIMDQLKQYAEVEDFPRLIRLLDKHILRINAEIDRQVV